MTVYFYTGYAIFLVLLYGFDIYLMRRKFSATRKLEQKEKELSTELEQCRKLLNDVKTILKSLR